MIDKFVSVWDEHKGELEEKYSSEHPDSYDSIVTDLISFLGRHIDDYGETPNSDRVTVIDDGDYQGYRMWIVGSDGYQPSTYWAFSTYYGSCSGCDTFEAIRSWGDETPTEQNTEDYMKLALHLLQSARQIAGYQIA